MNDACRRVYGLDEVVTYSVVDGIELKARRAERAATALINQRDLSSADSSVELIERLLNAYDEIDVRLAAGGEPLESWRFPTPQEAANSIHAIAMARITAP